MQVTKATVHISGMVQPRSFENIKREVSIEAELGEGDNLTDTLDWVFYKGKVALAESLISELKARFDVRELYRVETRDELLKRLKQNTIFEAINANAPDLADAVVEDFWEELQPILEERKREQAEREAQAEARRQELAKLDLDGPDDDEDDTDEDETAESDTDDFEDEEDEDDLEEEYA